MSRDPKTTTPQLVSLPVGAAEAGVSVRTLRRRIADGQLRAYRVGQGRAVRVSLDDVRALLIPIGGGGR